MLPVVRGVLAKTHPQLAARCDAEKIAATMGKAGIYDTATLCAVLAYREHTFGGMIAQDAPLAFLPVLSAHLVGVPAAPVLAQDVRIEGPAAAGDAPTPAEGEAVASSKTASSASGRPSLSL
jgi:hypothetical protein